MGLSLGQFLQAAGAAYPSLPDDAQAEHEALEAS